MTIHDIDKTMGLGDYGRWDRSNLELPMVNDRQPEGGEAQIHQRRGFDATRYGVAAQNCRPQISVKPRGVN